MEFDDELIEKLERLVRETDVREINIHVREPARKKQAPVAGFPFSLIEQVLDGVFSLTERLVESIVRRFERRLMNKRR